jgi:hypothetical protein
MSFHRPFPASLVPAAALLALAGGCASHPQTEQVSNAVGVECPAGHTLTCETRTTGRIHHGSFGRDNDRCACVSNDRATLNSPVIPSIRQ